jgi:hypothetical protein
VDRSDWLAPEGEFTAPLTIFSLLHEQDSKADSSFLPTIVMTTVQHSEDFCCAFCYAPAKKLLVCGRCLKRRYCSKDCQSSDWKEASHKYFCGKAGEIGIDYDIRPTEDGRGLGVFTRRSFEKNDIIMAERPIIKANDDVFHKNGWDQIGWDRSRQASGQLFVLSSQSKATSSKRSRPMEWRVRYSFHLISIYSVVM